MFIRRGYVPDVILATIELPDNLQVVGTGCLIQATVCRPKRDLRSESNAKEISDGLPFLGNFDSLSTNLADDIDYNPFKLNRIRASPLAN